MKNHGKNSETILLNNTPYQVFFIVKTLNYSCCFYDICKSKGHRY